jgi:hypothetical protein
MKRLIKPSILFVALIFWTAPGLAGDIVYYAPDGSQITKAEYDHLIDGQAKTNKNLKKARASEPAKKSRQLISAIKPKATPNQSIPPKSTVVRGRKSSKISESDIRKIVEDILHLTNKRETDKLLDYLAPTYTATLKTENEEMSLSRKEYQDYLEEGWSGYGFYRARHENETIDISPDEQTATLETDVIEIASLIDGLTLKLRSHQIMMFEVIDGKILITGTEAQMLEL